MRTVDTALVIASHNAGKLREIGELMAPFGIEVSSSADHGIEAPEETETSFEGNARLKALATMQGSGLISLSDDSGLEVDVLGGAPGVYTADWAETENGRDFTIAMSRAWAEIQATNKPGPYLARFVSVLCLAWPDGSTECFRGEAEGQIVWPPRGSKGFGFDPVFVPTGHELTFGEMEPAEKHRISHRTRSFEAMLKRVSFG